MQHMALHLGNLRGGLVRFESMAQMPFVTSFNPLARDVHADNVAAGWWTNILTNEPLDRNVGEMLMLIVSELAEADEGIQFDLNDDKLPHRKMLEVELADAKIRILDLAGFHQLDLTGAAEDLLGANGLIELDWGLLPVALMRTVRTISRAMEGHRKNARHKVLTDRLAFEVELALALIWIHAIGLVEGLKVDDAVAEKRAYNRTRADHQIANRLKEDGKKY